jgi:hypothetical protein
MKKFFLTFTLAALLLRLLSGCSDDPNAVGLNMLPPKDVLKIDSAETRATSDTTFLYRTSGSSTRLLLGSYQNLRARMLLQFAGFSAIPVNAIIDSATLNFNISYRFKASTRNFLAFEVHKMLRGWSEQTFTWDSSDVPGTYRSTSDTIFENFITIQDTIVSLRIDNLVHEWIQSGNNSPEGVIFIPDTISTNIVLGISNDAVSTVPTLTVAYHSPSDTTLTLKLSPLQSTSVGNGNPPVSSTMRYIQAGVAYRALLRFDSLVSVVPSKVSVLQATLEIATDTVSSIFNDVSHDSILVYLLKDNTPPYTNEVLGTLCIPAYNGVQKIFRSDIRNMVQQWVTQGPNYGIAIRTFNEFTSLDRVALYNSKAAPSLKPKLKIVYTILP